MNCYTIDTLIEGIVESFDVTITQDMIDKFLQITGDINPMHSDDDFARSKGFPSKIVYGMLTSSFISTLAGVYLPGRDCLIHSIETSFIKPVYIGDVLTIKGTVKKVDVRFKQLEIKIDITNQNSQKVVRGILKAGVLNGGE